MKNILPLIILTLAMVFPAMTVTVSDYFAGTGTAVSTNLYYYVAKPVAGNVPRLKYLNVTGDTAGSDVQFYTVTNSITLTNTTAASSVAINALSTNPTNVVQATGVLVIHDVSENRFQRCKALALIDSDSISITNNTTAATTSWALAAGDIIYLMHATGTIPVSNTAKTVGPAEQIYVGQNGQILLMEIDGIGTNTLQIHSASGDYVRP